MHSITSVHSFAETFKRVLSSNEVESKDFTILLSIDSGMRENRKQNLRISQISKRMNHDLSLICKPEGNFKNHTALHSLKINIKGLNKIKNK